ncbi:Nse4 C-terminal-domain-containing protein [Suillus cothurnatus]|nr:Nse4 C-terminal-domain-containing protein [Suillus cothurnatus]
MSIEPTGMPDVFCLGHREMDIIVNMINILENSGPVNIFRFIINLSHFGQSVENLYYLSSLFHNGICAFELTEDREPVIYRIDGVSQWELVFEFDMGTWRRAISVFDIQESMIPHREPLTMCH